MGGENSNSTAVKSTDFDFWPGIRTWSCRWDTTKLIRPSGNLILVFSPAVRFFFAPCRKRTTLRVTLTLNLAYFFPVSDFRPETPANSRARLAPRRFCWRLKSNPLLTATVQKTSWIVSNTWCVCKYLYLENVKSTVQNLVFCFIIFSVIVAPSKSNLFQYVSSFFLHAKLLKIPLRVRNRTWLPRRRAFPGRARKTLHTTGIEHAG